MAMTITEANTVAHLLHHLDGSKPWSDVTKLVDYCAELAERAGKPLLLRVSVDKDRLAAALTAVAAAQSAQPAQDGDGHGTADLLEELQPSGGAR